MQQHAMSAITNVCNYSDGLKAVALAGGIPAVVQLLNSSGSNPETVAAARDALVLLAQEPKFGRAIVRAGGIKLLVPLLADSSKYAHQEVLVKAVLGTTMKCAAAWEAIVAAGGIEKFVAILQCSGDDEQVLLLVAFALRHLSEQQATAFQIAAAGGIQQFQQLESSSNGLVQFVAQQTLQNIAKHASQLLSTPQAGSASVAAAVRVAVQLWNSKCPTSAAAVDAALVEFTSKQANRRVFAAAGGVPAAVQVFTQSSEPTTQGQAAAVLGNMADEPCYAAQIAQSSTRVVATAMDIIQARDNNKMRMHWDVAAGLLHNLVIAVPAIQRDIGSANGVKLLVDAIATSSRSTATNAAGHMLQLLGLLAKTPTTAEALASAGVVKALVALLSNKGASEAVQCLAADALRVLVHKHPASNQAAAAAGIGKVLVRMLASRSEQVQVAACELLGRMEGVSAASGANSALPANDRQQLFGRLCGLVSTSNTVQEPAAGAIRNIAQVSDSAEILVKEGVVKVLLQMLQITRISMLCRQHVVAALYGLVHHSLDASKQIETSGGVDLLVHQLKSSNEQLQVLVANTLSSLASVQDNGRIKLAMLKAGVMDALCKSSCKDVQDAGMRLSMHLLTTD